MPVDFVSDFSNIFYTWPITKEITFTKLNQTYLMIASTIMTFPVYSGSSVLASSNSDIEVNYVGKAEQTGSQLAQLFAWSITKARGSVPHTYTFTLTPWYFYSYIFLHTVKLDNCIGVSPISASSMGTGTSASQLLPLYENSMGISVLNSWYTSGTGTSPSPTCLPTWTVGRDYFNAYVENALAYRNAVGITSASWAWPNTMDYVHLLMNALGYPVEPNLSPMWYSH